MANLSHTNKFYFVYRIISYSLIMNMLLWLGSFIVALHPLHISVTEIEFDEKDKSLEIMIRVFTEDLEEAIRDERKDRHIDILNPGKGITTNQLLSAYLKNHIKISLDTKQQTLEYLGHESEGEAIVCYLQVSNVKKWKTIEVFNDIIISVYDDQSNIIHVTVQNKVKSARLTENNLSGKLTF